MTGGRTVNSRTVDGKKRLLSGTIPCPVMDGAGCTFVGNGTANGFGFITAGVEKKLPPLGIVKEPCWAAIVSNVVCSAAACCAACRAEAASNAACKAAASSLHAKEVPVFESKHRAWALALFDDATLRAIASAKPTAAIRVSLTHFLSRIGAILAFIYYLALHGFGGRCIGQEHILTSMRTPFLCFLRPIRRQSIALAQ